jgi:hypothetical protein
MSEVIRGAENRSYGARADEYAGRISVYEHRVEHDVLEVPQTELPTGGEA